MNVSVESNTGINSKKTPFRVFHYVFLTVQGLLSAGVLYYIFGVGLLPSNISLAFLGLTFALFSLCAFLQLSKNGTLRSIGAIMSIFISGMLVVCLLYLQKINQTLSDISRAQLQTDNMVVVVRVEDPAQNIEDTVGYAYGICSTGSSDRLSEMIADVEDLVGKTLNITEYPSPYEQGNALLNGDTDALIYNSALTSLLDEVIKDYSDRVRVIYSKDLTYEVETEETEFPAKDDAPITERAFNIYISGIDVSGPIATTSRSDVNIIMTVNARTHKILLTTTPRDYYVVIPGISGDMRDKLTHAGIYGVGASMAALGNLYGVQMDYYLRINFTSLIRLVDVLGGVDVHSEYAFSHGSYKFVQGINHLDGDAALAFSRERYAFPSGDNQRGRNQQAVITAIIAKLQSPDVLKNAEEIMKVFSQSIQTNVPKEDIVLLINNQISEMPHWSVESQQATGTGDSQATYSMGGLNLYVMWPDEDVVITLSDRMQRLLAE